MDRVLQKKVLTKAIETRRALFPFLGDLKPIPMMRTRHRTKNKTKLAISDPALSEVRARLFDWLMSLGILI